MRHGRYRLYSYWSVSATNLDYIDLTMVPAQATSFDYIASTLVRLRRYTISFLEIFGTCIYSIWDFKIPANKIKVKSGWRVFLLSLLIGYKGWGV